MKRIECGTLQSQGHAKIFSSCAHEALDIMPSNQNKSHAVMAQRHEALDSLDDFPTPPWATRALMEHIRWASRGSCLEPACNAGHMSKVLMEYFEGAIPMKLIDNMARDLMDRNDPTDIVTKAAVVTSIIKNKTQAAEVRVTINNSRVRLRVSNNLLKDHGIKKFGESQRVKFHDILVKIADRFKDDYENDYENLITKLNDRIDDLLA